MASQDSGIILLLCLLHHVIYTTSQNIYTAPPPDTNYSVESTTQESTSTQATTRGTNYSVESTTQESTSTQATTRGTNYSVESTTQESTSTQATTRGVLKRPPPGNYTGYTLFRVSPSSELNPLRAAAPYIDAWTPYDVLVPPDELSDFEYQLESLNMVADTIHSNVQELLDREQGQANHSESSSFFRKYHSYQEIITYLENLANHKRRDIVAKLDYIGTSVENRKIPLMKLSSRQGSHAALIIVDGGIHGRDWASIAMALYLIDKIANDPLYSDFLSVVDWHILPLLNPDGYEYTRTHDRLWKKNRAQYLCSDSKYEAKQGVDLNRNFGFHWNEDIGLILDPCSSIYPGPKANSEPETIAFKNYAIKNTNWTDLYISLHSYGGYILYPWGYATTQSENEGELIRYGVRASKSLLQSNVYDYVVDSMADLWTPNPGSSMDFMHALDVDFAYTVYLGGINATDAYFDPPQTIVRLASRFFPAMRSLGHRISVNNMKNPPYVIHSLSNYEFEEEVTASLAGWTGVHCMTVTSCLVMPFIFTLMFSALNRFD